MIWQNLTNVSVAICQHHCGANWPSEIRKSNKVWKGMKVSKWWQLIDWVDLWFLPNSIGQYFENRIKRQKLFITNAYHYSNTLGFANVVQYHMAIFRFCFINLFTDLLDLSHQSNLAVVDDYGWVFLSVYKIASILKLFLKGS